MDFRVQDFETKTMTTPARAWEIAATVCDPEIPVLTIADLGILRDVQVEEGDDGTAHATDSQLTHSKREMATLTASQLGGGGGGSRSPKIRVTITPTYSGCPAMDAIRDDLKAAFAKEGYGNVEVDLVLAPAWTTDWMTPEGKAKLEEYGIAPPSGMAAAHQGPIKLKMAVKCPQCSSLNTKELTRFGSTSCKALYVCQDCKEPFDYFKVL